MDRKRYLKTYMTDYRGNRKFLNLAMPLDEFERLERAAAQEGLKPGRFAVELALRHVDGAVYVPAALQTELKALRYLIRTIANNLNQIAHHTNAVRKAADHGAVFAELKRLETVIADYTTGRLKERIAQTPADILNLHLQTLNDHKIYDP